MDPETATVGEDATELEARSVDSRSTGSLRDFIVGDSESESESESESDADADADAEAEVAPDPALLDKPRAMRDRATIRTPKVLYADVEAHTSADLEYEEYLESTEMTASERRAALYTFKDLPLEEKSEKLNEVLESEDSEDEIFSEQGDEDEEYCPSPPEKKRKREDAE